MGGEVVINMPVVGSCDVMGKRSCDLVNWTRPGHPMTDPRLCRLHFWFVRRYHFCITVYVMSLTVSDAIRAFDQYTD